MVESITKKPTIVVLGAGISGHTAALYLKKYLNNQAIIKVISPEEKYNWIPSNIWVGVNRMKKEDVLVPLHDIYKKQKIEFLQAKATEIYPEGNKDNPEPYVVCLNTINEASNMKHLVHYDYLINATGPKLNFAATPGLGPEKGHTVSVCTASHASEAAAKLTKCIEKMKHGETCTLVVGMGHGKCTCEGAAFEYVFNVDAELRKHGVREKAHLIYLTNEESLGDFGVDGLSLNFEGYQIPSKIMAESLFEEKNIAAILGVHVEAVDETTIHYTTLSGDTGTQTFDFAMLLPPFTGHRLACFDKQGKDISEVLFTDAHFMKVDADYAPKPYEQWSASDWPKTYQTPAYPNIFSIGIAFAPPHQISMPRKNPDGVIITPSPPRTGMPSATMGHVVAQNIAHKIKTGEIGLKTASMAYLGAACVASIGFGFKDGMAVSITMCPIVPNYEKYPETGRDRELTFGEVGRAGHWIKSILHYMFLYKSKANPLWWLIPE